MTRSLAPALALVLSLLTLPLAVGCSPSEKDSDSTPRGDSDSEPVDDSEPQDDTQHGHTGHTGHSGETGHTGHTGHTGDTTPDSPVHTEDTAPEPYWDCDALTETPLEDIILDYATAYHGIVFSDDGYLIGHDARSSLARTCYDGEAEIWIPGLSGIQGLDQLADGDFVAADSSYGRVLRITPDGDYETIASLSSAYAVVVGPDQKVWVANGAVYRVDPDTGESEEIVRSGRWTAHSLGFNLDSTRLYIGTIGSGDTFYIELDEDLNPASDPQLFARGVGRTGSGYHDGLEVDACGNVYFTDYYSSGLYRVTEAGSEDGSDVTEIFSGVSREYGHAIQYGNGVGGWRADSMFLPLPYGGDTVRELNWGIPSGDAVRTWNGVRVPW